MTSIVDHIAEPEKATWKDGGLTRIEGIVTSYATAPLKGKLTPEYAYYIELAVDKAVYRQDVVLRGSTESLQFRGVLPTLLEGDRVIVYAEVMQRDLPPQTEPRAEVLRPRKVAMLEVLKDGDVVRWARSGDAAEMTKFLPAGYQD